MIHKTAIVNVKAKISSSVKIGPYVVIGPDVELGDNVEIHSHVNISGNTKIDSNTKIFPFSSIGTAPQDLKYKGESGFKFLVSAAKKIKDMDSLTLLTNHRHPVVDSLLDAYLDFSETTGSKK